MQDNGSKQCFAVDVRSVRLQLDSNDRQEQHQHGGNINCIGSELLFLAWVVLRTGLSEPPTTAKWKLKSESSGPVLKPGRLLEWPAFFLTMYDKQCEGIPIRLRNRVGLDIWIRFISPFEGGLIPIGQHPNSRTSFLLTHLLYTSHLWHLSGKKLCYPHHVV